MINLYDSNGAARGTIRRDVPAVPVTEEIQRQYKADLVEQASEQYREIRSASLETAPVADTLPAYSYLHFDQSGNLWVREFSLTGSSPEAQDRYSIFGPDGRWLAQLEVPSNLFVIDHGADYVLTRARDEFDIEQIRLYRIRRSDSR